MQFQVGLPRRTLGTSRTMAYSNFNRVNISFLTESEVKLFDRGTTGRKGKQFEDEIEPL